MLRTATIAVAAVLLAGSFGASAAPARPFEAVSTALDPGDVYELFANRSWIWENGAGYFAAKDRKFTAWSREGGRPSYAEGRWFITGADKLCFRGEWHAVDGSARATNCFSHREKQGVIYQKREPDGEWYRFGQLSPRRSGELAKLRRGDHVASNKERIAAQLGAVRD